MEMDSSVQPYNSTPRPPAQWAAAALFASPYLPLFYSVQLITTAGAGAVLALAAAYVRGIGQDSTSGVARLVGGFNHCRGRSRQSGRRRGYSGGPWLN